MFYDTFKEVCRSKGMKPTTVLRSIGVGTSQSYRTDGCTPKSVTLYNMCLALDVPVDRLIPVDEMTPEVLSLHKAFSGDCSLASKLQLVRCESELNYDDLGAVAGVTGTTVRKWSCGQSSPRVRHVDLFCQWLGIRLAVLLDGDVKLDYGDLYEAEDMESLEQSIRCVRALSGESIQKFSETIGMCLSTLHQLEENVRSAFAADLQLFSKQTGVPVKDLCNGIEHNREFSSKVSKLSTGERVRYYRIRAGKTQTWLARQTHIQEARLNRIERDPTCKNCTREELFNISKALEIHSTFLDNCAHPSVFL